ncbi:MAG: phosphate regulon sensor histidine kinase PhoR [Haliea sp.]|jgi:two-component system phosphate regulon sensor histidine kinase PhoR|nr:phosphate regulon sensor histidine kinase PhoR [Haliea sp.]
MHWFALAFRVLLFLVAGIALGWYFGYPVLGGVVAILAVVFFWCYQMWRLQQWLNSAPEQPPADVYGIWGEIIARIYRHQREAAETQRRLQSTVDYLLESFTSLRDGVVIVERGGGIRWCNETATRLLGLRFPQDTGQAITNLVRHPDFSAYVHAGQYAEPLDLFTSGDSKLHLQVTITRFGEGDSLIFVRDVTERQKMEQMRRDFVANVSHELRTPLTVITGYLGTMLADSDHLPPPYVRPMQQMEQQAERMENLLKDLLWLSRIESEERQEKLEAVDVGALLEELRDELSGTHPGRVVELELECQHGVTGDYRELYSAVSNLVHNAMKYSTPECPVAVSWGERDGNCILSVRDRGVGIDQVHIPRLTERFYRVDDSRSSATGGTGLGLAIVKHVAASHGAALEVESELGSGSTFTLVFPGSIHCNMRKQA